MERSGRVDCRGAGLDGQAWMARAQACEMLSLAFLCPEAKTAAALSDGGFAAALQEAMEALRCGEEAVREAGAILSPYAGRDAEDVFHEIRREHTRLFVGVRKPLVTPYLGVWVQEEAGKDALLAVGARSMEIERFMRRCGVSKNVEAGQANDPMDHVGSVCEFLEFLCLVNARAVRKPEGSEICDGDYAVFIGRYLQDYGRFCCAHLREASSCGFYRAAALLLEAVLEDAPHAV